MLLQAIRFATTAHSKQFRKYTNRPYIEHPLRVMGRAIEFGASNEEACAAVLHDVVEDCEVTIKEIEDKFSILVGSLVYNLTNPSKQWSELSRKDRKELDRKHLSTVPTSCKIIKLIDRIDNLNEISGADPKFISLYVKESRLLADVLKDSSLFLYDELIGKCDELCFLHKTS